MCLPMSHPIAFQCTILARNSRISIRAVSFDKERYYDFTFKTTDNGNVVLSYYMHTSKDPNVITIKTKL